MKCVQILNKVLLWAYGKPDWRDIYAWTVTNVDSVIIYSANKGKKAEIFQLQQTLQSFTTPCVFKKGQCVHLTNNCWWYFLWLCGGGAKQQVQILVSDIFFSVTVKWFLTPVPNVLVCNMLHKTQDNLSKDLTELLWKWLYSLCPRADLKPKVGSVNHSITLGFLPNYTVKRNSSRCKPAKQKFKSFSR